MFSNLFSKGAEPIITWHQLNTLSQLNEIDVLSQEKPVLIFKHSTRCSISAMALNRFERGFDESAVFVPYFLDLITYREVSNEIEKKYRVMHESPQVILISGGNAIYDTSHNGISFEKINEEAKGVA